MSHTAAHHANDNNIMRYLKSHMRDYALLLSLLVIMLFFQVVTKGIFFTAQNMTNIIMQNSYIVVMALGMLLVIVAGHIDLSVGSVAGFVGAVAAIMMTGTMPFVAGETTGFKIDPFTTSAFCLLLGAAIGGLQGFFVAYLKIPAFIVTLAGMMIFRGMMMLILGNAPISPLPPLFDALSQGYLPDYFNVKFNGAPFKLSALIIGVGAALITVYFNVKERREQAVYGVAEEPAGMFWLRNLFVAAAIIGFSFLMASYLGLPIVLIVMTILVVFFIFLTTRTTVGRRIYAMGGNEKATKLSGINTDRLTMTTFAIMGALAALGGLIFAARANGVTPKGGVGLELDVIAACFIGGTATTGGVGKVTGVVIGAFFMGVMNNGMSLYGVGIDWQMIVKGVVLMLAVSLDVYYKNKA